MTASPTRSAMAVTFLATGLLCLSVFITSVAGIKCFQCNSKVDEGCGNLTAANFSCVHYMECDKFSDYEGYEPFCRKTDVTIQKDEVKDHRIDRGCGWKKHHLQCYVIEEASYSERVCQCYTDGCNPAAPTLPLPGSVFLVAATVSALLMDKGL